MEKVTLIKKISRSLVLSSLIPRKQKLNKTGFEKFLEEFSIHFGHDINAVSLASKTRTSKKAY